MLFELFKAFIIGIFASAPVGPAAVYILQKTLSDGHKAGFITSLGAAVVDCAFAAISLYAVSFVEDVIEANSAWIMLVGGPLVVTVGAAIFMKARKSIVVHERKSKWKFSNIAQSFGLCIANPGAFALMLALVALFRLDSDQAPHILFLAMIILGSLTYWFLFTYIFGKCRKIVNDTHLQWINRIAGVAVIVFGIVLFVKGVISL